MKTVCEKDKCAGCMACIDICPKNAIKIEDNLTAYNAVIDEEKCVHCNACHKGCPSNTPCDMREPMCWYQGWANENAIRLKGSSGGLAYEISKSFVENGGVVCSCVFEDGNFKFKTIDKIGELEQFNGSKYVKSNPKGIYKEIKIRLKENQKVLFIALPCQVSALKKFVGKKLQKELYTIDLICHGTPSPKLLELFLNQYGQSLNKIENIIFRKKGKFQIQGKAQYLTTPGVTDKYSIAFLNAMVYTDNCYECRYATHQRVSDITLGDSWGTQLPMEQQKKGVSLILCQTDKGMRLLQQANLHLEEVDIENAIENNQQLKRPSISPANRDKFFTDIRRGKSFNGTVKRYLPKQCFRQDVKEILIKSKILGGGVRDKIDYGIIIQEKQ